nr:hypothetical protein [uncultured Cohaesibacter sp.]
MIRTQLSDFIKDENANAALEYALLAAIIGIFWVAAGERYVGEIRETYLKITRTLTQINF